MTRPYRAGHADAGRTPAAYPPAPTLRGLALARPAPPPRPLPDAATLPAISSEASTREASPRRPARGTATLLRLSGVAVEQAARCRGPRMRAGSVLCLFVVVTVWAAVFRLGLGAGAVLCHSGGVMAAVVLCRRHPSDGTTLLLAPGAVPAGGASPRRGPKVGAACPHACGAVVAWAAFRHRPLLGSMTFPGRSGVVSVGPTPRSAVSLLPGAGAGRPSAASPSSGASGSEPAQVRSVAYPSGLG